jgi:hypothetical protein
VHTFYSIYKFQYYSWRVITKEKGTKQLSIILGTLAQIVLFVGYYGWTSYSTLLIGATALGILHFYSMEIDYKYVLQVRPFAYLPFPLAALVFYYFIPTLLE